MHAREAEVLDLDQLAATYQRAHLCALLVREIKLLDKNSPHLHERISKNVNIFHVKAKHLIYEFVVFREFHALPLQFVAHYIKQWPSIDNY